MLEDEIDVADEEVVITDTQKDPIEKLRTREGEIERNAVDEDLDKLCAFSFTGKYTAT